MLTNKEFSLVLFGNMTFAPSLAVHVRKRELVLTASQSHPALVATTTQSKHWPCETAEALELFDMLSGSKVSSQIRQHVGRYMVKHGHFGSNEFSNAEKRLTAYPQAVWREVRVSPEGWSEAVTVHVRDMLQLFCGVVRHPRCDPRQALVWRPEILRDQDTDEHGYFSDLCNSNWCVHIPRG